MIFAERKKEKRIELCVYRNRTLQRCYCSLFEVFFLPFSEKLAKMIYCKLASPMKLDQHWFRLLHFKRSCIHDKSRPFIHLSIYIRLFIHIWCVYIRRWPCILYVWKWYEKYSNVHTWVCLHKYALVHKHFEHLGFIWYWIEYSARTRPLWIK